MTTAHTAQNNTAAQVLYMALDLGWDAWTIGFTVGLGQAPRQVSVRARRCDAAHGTMAVAAIGPADDV
jgi:hypothetical protein